MSSDTASSQPAREASAAPRGRPAPPAAAPEEYGRRLDTQRGLAAHWGRRDRILSQLRLATFAAIVVLGFLAFGTRQLSGWWVLPPVLFFAVMLVVHDRVIRRRERAERAVAHYERGLARLEDRWAGSGASGEAFRDPAHPYASDLDLFGEGSLFELLCTARTPAGEAVLASWLKAPAPRLEVQMRQQAVQELAPRVDLREDLALLGEDVRSQLDPSSLIAWGRSGGAPVPSWPSAVAAGLTALTALAVAAFFFTTAGLVPLLLALGLQAAFATTQRRQVLQALRGAQGPTRDLRLLSGLLARLEQEPWACPRLQALREALESDGQPPGRRIAELQRLVDLLDARANQFFAPIAALLLWGTHVGLAVARWRHRHGPELEGWIEAAAEIEALAALGGYAYEHPADPFPEVVDAQEGPRFEGRGLGHPLLPGAACIRNDVSLGGDRRAYMISGSNMSGKSTLLRTVGVNTVMALAGAPVRAEALCLSPLSVGASIQIFDSLREGTSHFYAEIKRLRQLMDLSAGEPPLLFLLDEVLHGTNSHDRRIGAHAIVEGLIERGAVGLVTTHDLALARIADELEPAVHNVHFQDTLKDGAMFFDYALQEGVVARSNALALMRSVGLEV